MDAVYDVIDLGVIPWLLLVELISVGNKTLSQLVKECQQAYPSTGEINFRVEDVDVCIQKVKDYFANQNLISKQLYTLTQLLESKPC